MQEAFLRISCDEIIGKYLTSHGKANQVRANAKAGTLSGRHADGGGEDVQHGKHCGGGNGHRHDLVHGQGLTRDKEERKSHGNTFHHILDQAS